MELKGERVMPVDRSAAWAALNDIDALKAAVPGCESITRIDDNHINVAVNAASGPVKSRFAGKLELADVVAPESYTIRFDLQSGGGGLSPGGRAARPGSARARGAQQH